MALGVQITKKICFVYSMSWPPKLVMIAIIYSSLRRLANCARLKGQASKCV